MQIVHEGSAHGAGANVATPELDLRVVGQAVAPSGDVLCPGMQGRVGYCRGAEFDLAGLAVGQEVDFLDALHPVEGLSDLRDAVERRIDDHDLGVGRDAVGQRLPARHAGIDEQDGIDWAAGSLRAAIGLARLVVGGWRVRVVLLRGVLRVLDGCRVGRPYRRVACGNIVAGGRGGALIRLRNCINICNIIVLRLRRRCNNTGVEQHTRLKNETHGTHPPIVTMKNRPQSA